jgi:hypothetical protein
MKSVALFIRSDSESWADKRVSFNDGVYHTVLRETYGKLPWLVNHIDIVIHNEMRLHFP